MNENRFPEVWLTTLETLKLHREVTAENTPSTRDSAQIDALLRFCIVQASADIVTFLHRLPVPFYAVETFDVPRRDRLRVHDLLEVEAVVGADGIAITDSDYRLLPRNEYPKDAVQLVGGRCGSSYGWHGIPCSTQNSTEISVTGWWGYVPHYPNAWKVLPMPGALAADAETLDFPAATAAALEVGDYLCIDDELVQVDGKTPDDADAPTLVTVALARGAQLLGTEAVTHEANAALRLFRQHQTIRTNATEWAAYLYKTLWALGERFQAYENGTLTVNGLSPLVEQALSQHVYRPAVIA